MGITLEQSEESSVIGLAGAIDIASAPELKKLLLQALESGKNVSVSIENTADLDVTAIELLWAAEREAKGSGVGFAFAVPVPERFSAALADAGFEKFAVPSYAR